MQPFEILEREFAEWNGLDPANMVACASGTAALHLAFAGNGDLPAGRCVMSDYVMVSCALGPLAAGQTPTFADCDRTTLNLDRVSAVREVMRGNHDSTSVSSLLAVHVYGRKCDMRYDWDGDTHRRMYVVEDLAEAHGVRVDPSTDAAVWSFYKNKLVAGEEGGAVWFHSKEHADRARLLRSIGTLPSHDYRHLAGGWNHRMSNAHAQPILASLREAKLNTHLRFYQWEHYHDAVPESMRCPTRPDSPWVYDVRLPRPGLREGVVAALASGGLPARFGFRPMTRQPQFEGPTPPTADDVWDRVVYINLDLLARPDDVKARARFVRNTLERLTGG